MTNQPSPQSQSLTTSQKLIKKWLDENRFEEILTVDSSTSEDPLLSLLEVF